MARRSVRNRRSYDRPMVRNSPRAHPPAGTRRADQGGQNRRSRLWLTKKRVTLPLALVVVMLIWWAVGGGDLWNSDSAVGGSGPTVTDATKAQAAPVGIGTKVRDGTFEFVVTSVERPGGTLAGKAGETLTAKGEFVIVRVTVTNVGDESQSPDCSCQFLIDDKGTSFEPSPAILSTKEALKFVALVEPGETVEGVLMLFDVVAGTKVVHIELHDSPTSEGVKVKLT